MELIYGLMILIVGILWGRAHERSLSLERRCMLLETELLDAQAKLRDEKLVLDRRLAIMLTRNGIEQRHQTSLR
jgi:hypothetical protein